MIWRWVTSNGFKETKYARLLLVVFRAFALATGLLILWLDRDTSYLTTPGWILVGVTVAYALYKLWRPFTLFSRSRLLYADILFDLATCLALPFLTGGIRSPFLLYMLAPLLTAALFMSIRIALPTAALPYLAILGSELIVHRSGPGVLFDPAGHPSTSGSSTRGGAAALHHPLPDERERLGGGQGQGHQRGEEAAVAGHPRRPVAGPVRPEVAPGDSMEHRRFRR